MAIGCIGMPLEEFCSLYFEEFENICNAWIEMHEAQAREEWERTRILAAICIQPHIKKKITPKQLLPLPWDSNHRKPQPEKPQLSKEELRARFENLKKRLS